MPSWVHWPVKWTSNCQHMMPTSGTIPRRIQGSTKKQHKTSASLQLKLYFWIIIQSGSQSPSNRHPAVISSISWEKKNYSPTVTWNPQTWIAACAPSTPTKTWCFVAVKHVVFVAVSEKILLLFAKSWDPLTYSTEFYLEYTSVMGVFTNFPCIIIMFMFSSQKRDKE